MRRLVTVLLFAAALQAQEPSAGLELHGSVTGSGIYTHELAEEPRNGGPISGGFRSVLYPAWKINEHWSIAGAVQVRSRPGDYDEYSTQGYGSKVEILQLLLTYYKLRRDTSLVIRVGELSSAFGSFLLRYDDAVNPLAGTPIAYAYYGHGVTTAALAGAQVDATWKRMDARAQLVNSSPANPRSVFDRDQYGSWAAGAGYTFKPGFRVGASAYRGPYLDRHSEYYLPGEARPRDLPGTAYGLDAQWGRGPWNIYSELQIFQFAYEARPSFHQQTGYVELRRTLNPRWYVATRLGLSASQRRTGPPGL